MTSYGVIIPHLFLKKHAPSQDSPSLSSPPIISSRSVSQALRPRFPEYADLQRRLSTFINWAAANPTSHDLAAAGFYYESKFKCNLNEFWQT